MILYLFQPWAVFVSSFPTNRYNIPMSAQFNTLKPNSSNSEESSNSFVSFFTQFSIEKFVFFLVLISAIFFSFYKINDLPPGTQYDQLRAVLVPEMSMKGIIQDFSIRQFVSYFILGGYWSALLIDTLRGSIEIESMVWISRFPSAMFFIFSTLVWWGILKEMKTSIYSKILFFIIFIPSALFITYSHYIPLVAGYLFFCSASILAYLKFINSKKYSLIYLYLAIILASLSTYTHGMSVFFMLAFYLTFNLFILINRRDIVKTKFKEIRKSWINTIAAIVAILIGLLLTFSPFVEGYLGADESIQIRNTLSITYLIEHEEYRMAIEQASERVFAYLHPANLISGSDFITGTQELSNTEWYQLRNPQYNQWWITNLGPFGLITALLFIFGPWIIYKQFTSKKEIYLLATSFFFAYILITIVPNFDNPSIAKTIPALMFIPLAFVALSEAVQESESLKKASKFIVIGMIVLALANSLVSIRYLYSKEYQEFEIEKFEYNYKEAFKDINPIIDRDNSRLAFHDNLNNNYTILEFFESPYVLEKTVWITESALVSTDVFDLEEDNYLLTKYEEDINIINSIDTVSNSKTYTDPVNKYKLHLIQFGNNIEKGELDQNASSNSLTGKRIEDISESTYCHNSPYRPSYNIEFESLLPGHLYNPSNKLLLTKECLSKNKDIYPISPYEVKRVGDVISTYSDYKSINLSKSEQSLLEENLTDLESISRVEINEDSTEVKLDEMTNISDDIFIEKENAVGDIKQGWELKSTDEVAYITFGLPKESAGTYLIELQSSYPENGGVDVNIIDRKTRVQAPLESLGGLLNDNRHQYTSLFHVEEGSEPVVSIVLVNALPLLDKEKYPSTVTISDLNIFKIADENLLQRVQIGEMDQNTYEQDKKVNITTSRIFGVILSYNYKGKLSKGEMLEINLPYSNLYSSSGLETTRVNGYQLGFINKSGEKEEVTFYNKALILIAPLSIIMLLMYLILTIPLLTDSREKN
jgi:hypothetical protein